MNPYAILGALAGIIAAFVFGYRMGGNARQVAWDRAQLAEIAQSAQIQQGNIDRLAWAHKHADEVAGQVYERIATLNDRIDLDMRRIAALGLPIHAPAQGNGVPKTGDHPEEPAYTATFSGLLETGPRRLALCARDYEAAASQLEAISHLQ